MISTPSPRARPLSSVGYLARALPHILSPFDGWAGHVVVILWLINAPTAALAGPGGLSYWVLGALVFFVPSLFAVAQLALLFPGDGGLYLWTYSALLARTAPTAPLPSGAFSLAFAPGWSARSRWLRGQVRCSRSCKGCCREPGSRVSFPNPGNRACSWPA